MAENKKSIIVYADWQKKFEALTDDEAGKLIKHFFQYVNDQNPKAPDRITELSFIDIEQSLKRDLKKWEKRAERSRENGKMGGRPSIEENPEKPTETQQVILEPRKPDSVNVSVNVNDSVNVINKQLVVEEEEPDSEFEMFVQTAKVKSLVRFVKQTFPKLEETLKMKIGEKNYLERQEAFILRNNEGSYTTNNDFRTHYTNFILKPPPEQKEKYSGQKEKINRTEQILSTHEQYLTTLHA